jgi:Peptide N-acetyl-beta-D-glucosaminyl asparaginase amidase A
VPPKKKPVAAAALPSTMKELKDTLWKAADKLRGSMDASQYKVDNGNLMGPGGPLEHQSRHHTVLLSNGASPMSLPVCRAPRRALVLLLALACAIALTLLATGPAHAAGYLENGSDDPVTAAPPVTRPDTPHCTVTLAHHFMSNSPTGSPQNYSGTLIPPAACRGPWSKVVLDSTTSVSGRQYDRSGTLSIGGVTVWFGTTQEPSGATPTTFSFSKDITRFSSLLRTPQPFTGGIGNYMSSVYTGNYDQTVTVTYYQADATHPAAVVPDRVVPVPISDLHPGTSTSTATLSDLPRNITSADLEVTLKGNGCDEQWFTAVPDEVAAKFPGAGVCASSAWREALVSLDGARAGAVGTYPHIYSGGIVPTLWRPVLAIDTLDLRPEHLDLTPFAGRLVDGQQHQISVGINPIGDTWNVAATLFLTTDHRLKQTLGALTTDDVAPAAATATTSTAPTNGAVDYRETATRHDVTAGYVISSEGRVATTVGNDRSWSNAGTLSGNGLVQSIQQSDKIQQHSTSSVGARVVRTSDLSESYPISVDYSAAQYVDDQNFTLSATVHMGQQVASSGIGAIPQHWNWTVDSYGILSRSGGVTTESDGYSTTAYDGTDDLGRPYRHTITTNHGRVVTDVVD